MRLHRRRRRPAPHRPRARPFLRVGRRRSDLHTSLRASATPRRRPPPARSSPGAASLCAWRHPPQLSVALYQWQTEQRARRLGRCLQLVGDCCFAFAAIQGVCHLRGDPPAPAASESAGGSAAAAQPPVAQPCSAAAIAAAAPSPATSAARLQRDRAFNRCGVMRMTPSPRPLPAPALRSSTRASQILACQIAPRPLSGFALCSHATPPTLAEHSGHGAPPIGRGGRRAEWPSSAALRRRRTRRGGGLLLAPPVCANPAAAWPSAARRLGPLCQSSTGFSVNLADEWSRAMPANPRLCSRQLCLRMWREGVWRWAGHSRQVVRPSPRCRPLRVSAIRPPQLCLYPNSCEAIAAIKPPSNSPTNNELKGPLHEACQIAGSELLGADALGSDYHGVSMTELPQANIGREVGMSPAMAATIPRCARSASAVPVVGERLARCCRRADASRAFFQVDVGASSR